ncbi:MAG: hypothetical protein ACFFDW_11235 [Candidatus Thorarchaeota archaeon]
MKKNVFLLEVFMIASIFLVGIFSTNTISVKNTIMIEENVAISPQDEIEHFDLIDFKNFTQFLDDPNIDSWNSNYEVDFYYDGSTSDYPIKESYICTFDEYGNATYFEIYARFNYTLENADDRLSYRMFCGSYYNYTGEYIGMPYNLNYGLLCGGGIWDAWDASTGCYVNVGYPYGVKDQTTTSLGSMITYTEVVLHLVRNESGLYSEVINYANGNYFLMGYWDEGIDIPVNYILLDFYTGQSISHVGVMMNNITGVVCFGNESIDILPPYDMTEEPWNPEEPDINTPFVLIDTPDNGATYDTSDIYCVWEAWDDESGLAYCLIRIDSNDWINKGLVNNHTFYDLSDGSHTLAIEAVDNADNWIIYYVYFTIDTSTSLPPTTSPPTSTPPTTGFSFSIPGYTFVISMLSIIALFGLSKIIVKKVKR